MSRLGRLRRLLTITRVFVRHGLDEFVVKLPPLRPYRRWLRLMPWRVLPRSNSARGVRLREALEELGPIFIKFGQMLSTRPDLLPEDIALELSQLQDRVPPFPGADAVAAIELAYGGALENYFSEFDRTPIASASVAQVHFARLHDGTEVAVKVLRPGIDRIIERDVGLLYMLARLALRYWPDAKRLRPLDVVDEYNYIIHGELDLAREAANASQLRANFVDSELLYVPRVFWDYTRRTVMTMERVGGIPIGNIDALHAAGIDMRQLAHNGVEIFFTQAFRDGFFHADMHPGNIFVSPEGQYRAIDFGIMGMLSDEDKHYLAQNLLGFFNRDYHAIAAAHLHAGWAPPETRIDEFEAAIRAVCEPIFAKPLKEISFGRVLLGMFETARRFDIEIQPQLVLLEKTLFNIEGLGRRLYPDLDLWVTAKPYLESWMRDQIGPQAWLRSLKREIPRWARILPEFPALMHSALMQAQTRGQSEALALTRMKAEMLEHNRRQGRRTWFGLAATAITISGVILAALEPEFVGDAALGITTAALMGGAFLFALAWPRRG